MAICKHTLYKYVKVVGTWRYCKAAYHDNGKIKPDIVFVNVKEELLEKHTEGRYYMSHNGQWTDAGTDALEAQRKRKQRLALDEYHRLSGANSVKNTGLDNLAFQLFVVLEETPNHQQSVLRKFAGFMVRAEFRISGGNGDHLVIIESALRHYRRKHRSGFKTG